jgi:hypothetical protein
VTHPLFSFKLLYLKKLNIYFFIFNLIILFSLIILYKVNIYLTLFINLFIS